MKKLFTIALLVVLNFTLTFAQDTLTTYDGNILKIGDTIKIGYCHFSEKYQFIKEKLINEYKKAHYYHSNSGKYLENLIIIDFLKPEKPIIFPNHSDIVLAKGDNNVEYFIEINSAIDKGEIISELPSTLYPNAVYLSDEMIFAAVLRVNNLPITDMVILDFIGIHDHKLKELCKKNEFEFHKAKPGYLKKLEHLINSFDFEAVYYIKNDLLLNKYDFTRNGYPVDLLLSPDNFLSYKNNYTSYSLISEKSIDQFKFLPVPFETAEKINKRRMGKGSNGYISPSYFGKFYINLINKRMVLPKSNFINMEDRYRHRIIGIVLVGLEVFDYNHCDYNYIGSIKQPF